MRGAPAPGGARHHRSRATATAGGVQPAPDAPWLAGKQTDWESTGHATRRILLPAAGQPPRP